MFPVELRCPNCDSGLLWRYGEEVIPCAACGRRWGTIEGKAPDFVEADVDYCFYGETDRATMEDLLKRAPEKGWRRAVNETFQETQPLTHALITGPAQADFRFLIPMAGDAVVLDAGAGWGAVSIPFASWCRAVVALEDTVAGVRFLRLRAGQEATRNVYPIRASILSPPFRGAQFDLVIMNRVLGRVPLIDGAGHPEEVQRAALKNAWTLLKPGGCLYLGVENRFGFKYILGIPEDHTALRFAGVMPRFLADLYSMRLRGAPFRTYTHSYGKYRKLLKEAGFGAVSFYYPSPDYKLPQAIVPLDAPGGAYRQLAENRPHPGGGRERVARLLERLAHRFGRLRYFAPGFSILAAKGKTG
jgi:SAM-dependent methyltransferase